MSFKIIKNNNPYYNSREFWLIYAVVSVNWSEGHPRIITLGLFFK